MLAVEQTPVSTRTLRRTGGNGGSHNTGGNGGLAIAIGPGAYADASGGDVDADGGDAYAGNSSDVDQSNQVGGNANENGYEYEDGCEGATAEGGENFAAACNADSENTCSQSNDADVFQNASATGGNGGSHNTGGDGGQAFAVGGGEPMLPAATSTLDGGDAWAGNWSAIDQSNQVAGNNNDNGGSGVEQDGGDNFTALCNGSWSRTPARSRTTRGVYQGASATGGNGGSHNSGGNGGQAETVGSLGEADASGGDVDADGGDAGAFNGSEIDQSNQIAGKDNQNDYGYSNCKRSADGETAARTSPPLQRLRPETPARSTTTPRRPAAGEGGNGGDGQHRRQRRPGQERRSWPQPTPAEAT